MRIRADGREVVRRCSHFDDQVWYIDRDLNTLFLWGGKLAGGGEDQRAWMVDVASGVKVKGLLKGLRYISQIFDPKEEEEEQDMQIGYPTDVKHVAHIGWDGPSANTNPTWMNDFKSAPGPVDANGTGTGTGTGTAAAQLRHPAPGSDPHLGSGSSQDLSATQLPRTSRRVGSPNQDGSSSKPSRRQQSSGAVSSGDSRSGEPSEGAKQGRKHLSSTAGTVGVEQPTADLPAVSKQSHRRKAKGSSSGSGGGGKTKSSSRSKAAQSESGRPSKPNIDKEEEEKGGDKLGL